MKGDPLMRLFIGRNAVTRVGWRIHFAIAPAVRLMSAQEQGRRILVGVAINLVVGRAYLSVASRDPWWRGWHFDFEAWSDADEISTRIARAAGQLA